VLAVPIEGQEQIWLRRVLHRHFGLTGSARTAELLRHNQALPFVRIQPVSLPCSIAETWEPILKYFPRRVSTLDRSRVAAAPSPSRKQRARLWNH
jgi:hypothetical protein